MTLNCKPGQLARVISHPVTVHANIADMIVQVTKLTPTWLGVPAWEFVGAPLAKLCSHGDPLVVEMIPDELLRPINNPGDDAVDEMVAKVGKAPVTHGKWETV